FSLGGFIAQAIAVTESNLLRKVILVGTAPQGTKALYSFPQLVERAFALSPMEGFLYIFATKSEKSRAKVSATLQRLMERKEDRDKETSFEAITEQVKELTRRGTHLATVS